MKWLPTIPEKGGTTFTWPTKEVSKASRKLVMKTYYQCVICFHQSQNKDSTYTHMCRHLNVTLACSWPKCNKLYEAPEGFKDHINKKHGRQVAPTTLSKEEAEVVVAGLSLAK